MICREIEKLVNNAASRAFPGEGVFDALVEVPRERAHGDYSANIALQIAKKIGGNPADIARKIAENMGKDGRIEKVEVIEPGFINFFLSEEALEGEALSVLKEGKDYGSGEEGKGKTVVIDYSSPNIAKSFGIGHLRSTIIGQAIYNIYEFRGWKCIGDNHLGDWGTQFGKLICQIKEKKLKGSEKPREVLEKLTIEDLENLYVDFHREAKDNPELEEKGRFWFEKLETGDEEAKEIWQLCVEKSLQEFNRIYDLLGIKIDYALGESFYLNMLPEVVGELKEKKITKESDGAMVVDFSEELPSLVAVKSDGATTYLVRDLAAIKYRIENWSPDLFIYEVGADQSLYFKQLFKTAELLGWKGKKSFIHIAHGLVRWKHGKFSTRKGETIHLEEILKEAVERALKIIEESENARGMSGEEKKKVAEMVGIGAVKYNDLSQHHRKDVVFSWEKTLNLKGNSGPYLQYTFARCKSVLRKGKFSSPEKVDFSGVNEEERIILGLTAQFKEVVKNAADDFSPNIICNFLFELAQSFNLFYNNNRIINKDGKIEERRMALTGAVAQILENGLGLLGIDAPERM